METKINEYIGESKKWSDEMTLLRSLVLECGLIEELKWGKPCYTFNKNNVVLIGRFKDYCVLSFLKGVLLNDEKNYLESPGENSQTVRMFKFTSTDEIKKLSSQIKAYLFEAIEVEKQGLKVELKAATELVYPDELEAKMSKDQKFKEAFEALTPGRKRGYIIFINGAKQSSTRETRIEKYVDRIFKGKGINDCVCGHSKRMPNCDGSHKFINL